MLYYTSQMLVAFVSPYMLCLVANVWPYFWW